MKAKKLTIKDIGQWIDNDEGLYNWQRSSGMSKRFFIKAFRTELEKAINKVLNREPETYTTDAGKMYKNPFGPF